MYFNLSFSAAALPPGGWAPIPKVSVAHPIPVVPGMRGEWKKGEFGRGCRGLQKHINRNIWGQVEIFEYFY